jgi:hypothetical protein
MIFIEIGFLILAYERGYSFWFTTLIFILLIIAEVSIVSNIEKIKERKRDD